MRTWTRSASSAPSRSPARPKTSPRWSRSSSGSPREDIAYKAEDGSWYFRIARFPEYGKLSKKDLEGIEDGARVDSDEYEKDSARDFALWKATKPGEA